MTLTHPSPNCGQRRGGARPTLIVLHYTAMANADAALARLCDPDAEVSAHYLIGRDGACAALVDEGMRAWHAGAGAWGGVADVNSASIGVELDNDGASPFSAPLMDRLERLLLDIMGRWAIPPERVIGHADMAAGRKSDPGPRFDWRRLSRSGCAVWPDQVQGGKGDFGKNTHRFGYRIDDPDLLLSTFRARFRPGVKGPCNDVDRALASNLAQRFPVDLNPSDT